MNENQELVEMGNTCTNSMPMVNKMENRIGESNSNSDLDSLCPLCINALGKRMNIYFLSPICYTDHIDLLNLGWESV